MEDVLVMVSQVGFPIVVAMYSLVRLETTVKQNTLVLTQLAERLAREGK